MADNYAAVTSIALCTLSMPPRTIACGTHHHACHQYFLVTMSKTRRFSDLGRFLATACTGSPLGLPRALDFWMVTRGVFLIRLVFHDPSSVEISSLSPSRTPHTGVGLGLPSLVNVVSSRYFESAMSWNVSDMGRRSLSLAIRLATRWSRCSSFPHVAWRKR